MSIGPTVYSESRPELDDPSASGASSLVMTAGRSLALVLFALTLAALLNASRQLERASHQPLGPERDRAVSVWKPVETISSSTGLSLARSALESVRDIGGGSSNLNEGAATSRKPGGPVVTTIPLELVPGVQNAVLPTPTPLTIPEPGAAVVPRELPTATATPRAFAPVVRSGTTEDPTRVKMVGDSTMIETGKALQGRLGTIGEVTTSLDSRASSGFTRPDFFDWPARFRLIVDSENPEIVIAMFGANDVQGMQVGDAVYEDGTSEWIDLYTERVHSAMAVLAQDDRTVVWIGQPGMRSTFFDDRIGTINQAYQDAAADFDNVIFIDTRELVSPDGYQAYGPAADGSTKQLRQTDGVHLTDAGGGLIANAVIQKLIELGYFVSS